MPSWRSSPSEREQRQKQGHTHTHTVYTCGLFHSKVETGVRLPRELYQKPTSRVGVWLTNLWKSKDILSRNKTHRRHAHYKLFLFDRVPIFFSPPHLTCRLVSCCCWWAMVCFTNTLLMLCSMAYFFAWKGRNVIFLKYSSHKDDLLTFITY